MVPDFSIHTTKVIAFNLQNCVPMKIHPLRHGISFHPSVSSFSSLKRRKMLMKGIYIIEESYLQNLLF